MIKKLFQGFLKNAFDIGLVHGDLSLKNSVIDSEHITWIIDWGCARSQVIPHYDFVEILENSLDEKSLDFRSFLDGYGYSIEEFNTIAKDVYTLMLLRSIDRTRWAKEKKPEVLELKIEELKKVLNKSAPYL